MRFIHAAWASFLRSMLKDKENEVIEEEEFEDDDDDPVFVLTDEWRDFFAKSEAKRKLGTLSTSFFFLWPLNFN